jgi:phosphoribosylformimino-5-aminoimidazole carboxamide ribotide isomerase
VRVIGVIDLIGGRAVRAYAGRRDQYQPIGDAVDLARRYVDHHAIRELYLADLDGIEAASDVARPFPPPLRFGETRRSLGEGGQGRDQHRDGGPERPALRLIRQIAAIGVPLWLDAGVSSLDDARHALDLGATHVVVGLETLQSFEALDAICAGVGGDRVAFSLDLRGGEPVAGREVPRETPERLAARAAHAGAGSIIVIDLARVGTRAGLDFELLARVREATPGVTLLAGGGVRGAEDLETLAGAGCDGVLVATALDALYPSASR